MCGAPQRRFSTLIRRISACKICSDLPSASQGAGFPAPIAAKAGTMPAHQRLRPDNRHGLEDRGKPAIQLDEEQAVAICEVNTPSHLALQHGQLMTERGVL